MKLLVLAVLVGSLCLAAFELPGRRAAELDRAQPSPTPEEVARGALGRAGALKRELVGARGGQRDGLRERAIEAYRAVRLEHPDAPGVGAEAAFRAGELLRAGGRPGEAQAEFRAAFEAGGGTPFRARAGLELGHLARRAERFEEALQEYERVRGDPRAEPAQRHEATLWSGRVYALEGRLRDAARLFERVARDAEAPLDALRGYDAWTAALIELGDLEGAAGVLEACRVSLQERMLEETRSGQRVRSAFEAMGSRARLERAVAERRARTPVRLPRARTDHPSFDRPRPPDARPPDVSSPPASIRRMGSSSQPLFPPTGF